MEAYFLSEISTNSCSSSKRINLSPFTKDFRGGEQQMSIKSICLARLKPGI